LSWRDEGGTDSEEMAQRTREIAIVEPAQNEAVVKSAALVLEVLSVFDDVRRDMRLGEIVERLGFPQSSTSVLLKSLVRLGYLDFDATTRSFSVTARVALLGSWIANGAIVNGSVARAMEELSSETGHTITLASRTDYSPLTMGIYLQDTTQEMGPSRLDGRNRVVRPRAGEMHACDPMK
jgi:IclR-like helix-turn-helix domain-containing protein